MGSMAQSRPRSASLARLIPRQGHLNLRLSSMALHTEARDLATLEFHSMFGLRRRRARATATTEFGAALDALGLQQRRVARWFGVSPRSVRRWQSGDRNLPCGVDVVFRLLVTGVITPTQVEQAVTRTNGSGTPEPPAPRSVEPAPETPVDPGPTITTTTAEKVYALAPETCRWPHGDPRHPDFHFCGRPAAGPYCEQHHTLAYMAPLTSSGHGATVLARAARPARQFVLKALLHV